MVKFIPSWEMTWGKFRLPGEPEKSTTNLNKESEEN